VSVLGRDGGGYSVSGSFSADVPPEVAWAVLTDYDNLASFVTSMRSSSATRDESGRLLVEQLAVGRAGPFSRTLHVVLEVSEEAPLRIAFRDVCGGSFHSYAGIWAIERAGDGVRVRYVLDARPRSAPPLFGRPILASNARGLLVQVQLEMQRRGRSRQ
jgi:carbon monoxide dehydrogenase subunit G